MSDKENKHAFNDYPLFYVLDEQNNPFPVPRDDEGFKKYQEFLTNPKQRYLRTTHENGYDIHSSFLGSNTTPGKLGRPKLFGTAIKRISDGEWIEEWEYDTFQECMDGHDEAVEMAKSGLLDSKKSMWERYRFT